MKKISLLVNKLKGRHFLEIWIAYHAALLIFFGIVFLVNPSSVKINADLFNMFPRPFEEEGVRNADEKLTEIVGQNVCILVLNKDFKKAKENAVQVYSQLENNDNFTTVSLYTNLEDSGDVTEYVYNYRWNLLSEELISLIEENPEAYAYESLMQANSPFTLLPLDNLESDPFMLAENNASALLTNVSKSGTAMAAKDGVIASCKDDVWYVMIRGLATAYFSSMFYDRSL